MITEHELDVHPKNEQGDHTQARTLRIAALAVRLAKAKRKVRGVRNGPHDHVR